MKDLLFALILFWRHRRLFMGISNGSLVNAAIRLKGYTLIVSSNKPRKIYESLERTDLV
jgi:hypothetical protein